MLNEEDKEKLEKEEQERIRNDLELYDGIVVNARKLFKERSIKYGRSFEELNVSSCIDLMRMKLRRMKSDNVGYKIEDEIQDMINYSIIMMMLHEEQKEEIKQKEEP